MKTFVRIVFPFSIQTHDDTNLWLHKFDSLKPYIMILNQYSLNLGEQVLYFSKQSHTIKSNNINNEVILKFYTMYNSSH